MNPLFVIPAALLLTCGASAADLPREFTVTPEVINEPPPFVTQVIVPGAICAAVSDAHSMLVVSHDTPAAENQHVAVFRLDAKGQPDGEPSWVSLPKPEVLKDKANYALGMLFHPRLPLLYVWQDIKAPPADKQENHPEFADYLEFDHLLIYGIKDGALELLRTGVRGAGFHCGQIGGTVGLDFAARKLFVPNARGETSDEGGVGFYALDEEGMPGESQEGTVTQPKEKLVKVSGKKDAPDRATRSVPLPKHHRVHRYYPTGGGWFAGSEAVLMGGYSGCLMLDSNNGNVRQSWFNLPDLAGRCSIAGHPKQPAIYIVLEDTSHLYQIAQVDGYLSLLPQVATVTAAHLTGIPAVLTQQGRLAVGDAKFLHLFGLQADGRLDGRDEKLALPCARAHGIVYSEKHGLLYVAVDKAN